jgi:uncharacterized membrane protein YkvA (DUF1232 family)
MPKAAKSSKARRPRPSSSKSASSVPYQKAAVRSRAFAKAILQAKSFTMNPESLEALFQEAAKKAGTLPKEPFGDTWAYFQAMLRLIYAYNHSEYRNASQGALLSIIAAVSYLVDPFDLIPDEIPFLGFLDDATVIAYAVGRSRETLDDFMSWEIRSLADR